MRKKQQKTDKSTNAQMQKAAVSKVVKMSPIFTSFTHIIDIYI